MLFLTKKTLVSVLALGCLLSIAPKAHAKWESPVTIRQGASAAGAAALAYATYAEVDHAKKDKGTLHKYHDKAVSTWQALLNAVTSKRALQATAVGVAGYLVLAHGSNVTNLPALQYVKAQLTPAPEAPARRTVE